MSWRLPCEVTREWIIAGKELLALLTACCWALCPFSIMSKEDDGVRPCMAFPMQTFFTRYIMVHWEIEVAHWSLAEREQYTDTWVNSVSVQKNYCTLKKGHLWYCSCEYCMVTILWQNMQHVDMEYYAVIFFSCNFSPV